ncbi:MAG: DUF1801 domain-containing protein [Candidatus Altimarinota bacterium]
MKGNTSAKTPREYLAGLEEPRKSELKKLDELIRKSAPSLKCEMIYGMLGYGKVHYKTKSGCEGEWFTIGLASQKHYISMYFCAVDGKQYLAEGYKKQLPKASIGKSCVRFKKLEQVDLKVIQEMIKKTEKLGPMNPSA